MAGRYAVTPWRHHRDLLTVRQQLYGREDPEQKDERRHAVDRLLAWKLRGNLPHAVESTALLVDAFLHHEAFVDAQKFGRKHQAVDTDVDNTVPAISEWSSQAVFSAAFTRFVTGFCDIGRNRERSLEPSSMLVIAKQIGMPTHFVSLRHEATHEEMPGLARLIRACEAGLQWLWEVYWQRLDDAVADSNIDEAQIKVETRRIFREFRGRKREAFRSLGRRKAPESESALQAAVQAFTYLVAGNEDACRVSMRVVVEDGILMPSDREIGSPLDGAYLMWDEFLIQISARHQIIPSHLLQNLLTAMTDVTAVNEKNDPSKEALMLWIVHVLDSTAWQGVKGIDRDARCAALKHICLHPGCWSLRLGQMLLDSVDTEMQALWRPLVEASAVRQGPSAEAPSNLQDDGLLHDVELTALPKLLTQQKFPTWTRATLPPTVPIGLVG